MADLRNPYRQLLSETGGQNYHMECEFCKEWGSMYSSAPFVHAPDCPAGKLEQEEFVAMRKRGRAVGLPFGIKARARSFIKHLLGWGR